MSEEMDKNKNLFSQAFPEDGDNRDVIEGTVGCLLGRLSLLDSVVSQRCDQMKGRLQQILDFQVRRYQEVFVLSPATFRHNRDASLRCDMPTPTFFPKAQCRLKTLWENQGTELKGWKTKSFKLPEVEAEKSSQPD